MNSDALAPPSPNFTRPPIVSYHMARSEEEQLVDWLKKNNPGVEVFIHPTPQEGKLKEWGWERFPATYKGKQIWIKRPPKSDHKLRSSA